MAVADFSARAMHALGRLRPALMAGQIVQPRKLKQTRRSYHEFGLRKPWFATVRHQEVAGKGSGTALLDRPDGLSELEADPRFQALDPELRRQLREWPERGFLIAQGLIEPGAVAAVNDEIDRLAAEGSIREHHLNPRIMNPHRRSQAADRVANDSRIIELIELILGRSAHLFQTISFTQGSQQEAHSDAFHMMTEPPGFLVGAWIALEDIDEGSGPVFYLPGSHRFPYLMTEDLGLEPPSRLVVADKGDAYVRGMRRVIEESGVEPETFCAKAGDVLLWHHNLTHGGSPVTREGATRRSLVGHYFAEGILCYHEVTERPALMPAAFD